MNLSDRRLKRLMRQYRIAVRAKKKEELLKIVSYYAETHTTQLHKEETPMKRKIMLRPAMAVLAVLLGLTTVVSAALATGYYFAAPDGSILDDRGNVVDGTASADTVTFDQNSGIKNALFRAVTWTTINEQNSLAVWVLPDAPELEGLTAVIDGVEYPLIQSTFNVTGGYIGYVATDVPKPEEFDLRCDNPPMIERVRNLPELVITAESTDNGITIFGLVEGNTVWYGINDEHFMDTELFQLADVTATPAAFTKLIDSNGVEYDSFSASGHKIYNEEVMMENTFSLNIDIAAIRMELLHIHYGFNIANRDGLMRKTKIPVPADGETRTGNWVVIDQDGMYFAFNSISRDGDTLHFRYDREFWCDPEKYPSLRSCHIGWHCEYPAESMYPDVEVEKGSTVGVGGDHIYSKTYPKGMIEALTDQDGNVIDGALIGARGMTDAGANEVFFEFNALDIYPQKMYLSNGETRIRVR